MLQGSSYNPLQNPVAPLQGSTQPIQGASAPAVQQQPLNTYSAPVAAKPVSTTVQQPIAGPSNPLDLRSRYANYQGGIIDKSTGQMFSTPEQFFQASGQRSFNGLIFDTNYQPQQYQTSQPAQTQQFQPLNSPSSMPAAPTDPNQRFAQQAGAAGMSADDYLKLVQYQNQLSPDELSKIKSNLGIPELEQAVFTLPSKSTQQLYNDAYSAAGLADIKAKFTALNDEINRAKEQENQRISAIGENPWLSEATRVGRVRRDTESSQRTIGNLIDQQSQLAELYNQGIGEVANLVSTQSTDFTNSQALNRAKLEYLNAQAEKQAASAQSDKTAKAARYLPDFLSSLTKSKKPDTIGNNETGFYSWDAATGTFKQIIAPQVQDTTLEDTYKALQIQKLQQELTSPDSNLSATQVSQFNSIAAKYAASPLVAAADRTIVLKNAIQQIRANPSNAAQQLNLSYAYIQALDTYQSAVREGELANLNSIDSKVGALQGSIQQIQNGQIVRPEVAKQIADAAESIINTIYAGAQSAAQRYAAQASAVGLGDTWQKFTDGFTATYQQGSTNDPLGLYSEQGGGIVPVVAKKYPEGSVGGQCGTFAHQLVQFPPVGDSKTQKIASVQKYGMPKAVWQNDVRVGDVIITGENPTYGHVAVVNAILPDGRIQLSESNFKQSNKVSHDRVISPTSSQIYGAIRGSLKIA